MTTCNTLVELGCAMARNEQESDQGGFEVQTCRSFQATKSTLEDTLLQELDLDNTKSLITPTEGRNNDEFHGESYICRSIGANCIRVPELLVEVTSAEQSVKILHHWELGGNEWSKPSIEGSAACKSIGSLCWRGTEKARENLRPSKPTAGLNQTVGR